MTEVLIVGGSFAGLTAARELRGRDVVILAGGEGARRLYPRVAAIAARTGAEVAQLYVASGDRPRRLAAPSPDAHLH